MLEKKILVCEKCLFLLQPTGFHLFLIEKEKGLGIFFLHKTSYNNSMIE